MPEELSSQITAWRELVRYGAFLAQNPHSSFFYLFTGLHALHLLGGMIALLVVLVRRAPRRVRCLNSNPYAHFGSPSLLAGASDVDPT